MSRHPNEQLDAEDMDGAAKERRLEAGSRAASCSPRSIGEIGNYYGGLSVKTEEGKHFWSIENYDGDSWDEIPADLFAALNAFEDSRENSQIGHCASS